MTVQDGGGGRREEGDDGEEERDEEKSHSLVLTGDGEREGHFYTMNGQPCEPLLWQGGCACPVTFRQPYSDLSLQ